MCATKSGVPRGTRSAKELAVRYCELHFFTTIDLLNPAVLASCETLDRHRQSAERTYDASSSQPSDEGAEDFMGTHESSCGAGVDHRRVAFWVARLRALALVHVRARTSREERAAAQRVAGAAGKAIAIAAAKGNDALVGGGDI